MSIQFPSQGEGYTPAYQISSTPFVTSSNVSLGQTKMIEFGKVSRFVTVKNNTASTVISVAFTENGLKQANSNYFFLSGSESFSAELRADRLFISGSSSTSNFTVVAGLTYILPQNFTLITGSNGFGGVG